MPQRKRVLLNMLLLGLLAVVAVIRRRPDDWEYERAEPEQSVANPPVLQPTAPRSPARRFALAAAFSTLFFAGAAFTAGAGDQLVRLADEDAAALETAELTGAPAAEVQPDPEAAAEPAPEEVAPVAVAAAPVEPAPAEPVAKVAPAPEPESSAEIAPSTAAAQAAEPVAGPAEPAEAAPSNVVAAAAPAAAAPSPSPQATASTPAEKPRATQARKWIVERAAAPPAPAPEIESGHGGEPTIWLNRALPDPTPPSARLARPFAKRLLAASKRHGADWAAVLGVLRAQGERGSVPASARELDALATRMSGTDAWKGALALSGRTAFADRAAAFADLHRFVGLETLVTGYSAARDRLARKLLSTPGVLIYSGGRSDIALGRIDVRVIVLVGYLAERHGSLTVSSLFSGHRRFARPGVVSAHVYGHAVDIAAVGGTTIAGNQQPGGLTEATVRSILLLPGELQPRQVISLLGLGGPSFPLRDHGDHIHVGF